MSSYNSMNEKPTDKYIQFVSFRVGEEIYGIPVTRSREVLYLEKMSHIPDSASFLKGVIDLRGILVPLVDLRTLFKLQAKDYDSDTVVIISKISGTVTGFIADAVLDVIMLKQDEIQIMKSYTTESKKYIIGMSKTNGSIILLLDVDRLLNSSELENITAVASA